MSIELRIAEEDEQEKWDAIVEASHHATIFHTWKWLKILEKHTKRKLYPIIGFKETTAMGIYPLFYQKTFLFKSVFSPPPKVAVPYLGPVIVDYDKWKLRKRELVSTEFQNNVMEFIESELRPHYTQITSPPNLPDSRPFNWTGYQVEPKYNYILDLSKGEAYVWDQFGRKLRKNIIAAQKKNVRIEEGHKAEIEKIYDFISTRYVDQGRVIPVSKKYLFDLYDSFYPKNLNIFIATCDGEFIGGSIKICYKDRLLSWIGHPKTILRGTPNDLMHWEAIKWAIEHNLKYYELIGANTERLCHYKSKYHPDLSICFSAKKYSSIMSKLAETAYFNILKPASKYIKLTKWQ